MSTQEITALTSLVVGLATLVTAITAVIKAVEAKGTAQRAVDVVAIQHAETVGKLSVVEAQTNGLLTASRATTATNTAAIETLKNDATTATATTNALSKRMDEKGGVR